MRRKETVQQHFQESKGRTGSEKKTDEKLKKNIAKAARKAGG